MPNLVNLTGKRFSRLYVIKRAGTDKWGQVEWQCRCNCGIVKNIVGSSLRRGLRTRCGCFGAEQQVKAARKLCRSKIGPKHPRWKGKFPLKTGYIRMRNPDYSDPRKQIFEHVYVMEQHLGRKLHPEESVHHKNGIRNDNRIENLELWASRHPSGQRVSDLLDFAHNIIARYQTH